MPFILPILAGLGLSGSALATAGTIATVVFWLIRIKLVISVFVIAFWSLVAIFAKDLLVFFTDIIFDIIGGALAAAGIQDPTDRIISLINTLPSEMLDVWRRLHVWSSVVLIFQAYAINFALTSIPFVGRIFRS